MGSQQRVPVGVKREGPRVASPRISTLRVRHRLMLRGIRVTRAAPHRLLNLLILKQQRQLDRSVARGVLLLPN